MTNAQTEARAIARLEFTCPDCDPYVVETNLGRYVRYADHAPALAAKAAELAEVHQQYVDANEARIDAEAQLAEARKALDRGASLVLAFLRYFNPNDLPEDQSQQWQQLERWISAARCALNAGGGDER